MSSTTPTPATGLIPKLEEMLGKPLSAGAKNALETILVNAVHAGVQEAVRVMEFAHQHAEIVQSSASQRVSATVDAIMCEKLAEIGGSSGDGK